jgi:hypothetical protein
MHEHAASLAFYLTRATGTPCGRAKVRMPAAAQRQLFGRYLGRGLLIIDGSTETIEHVIKRCFGLDHEVTARIPWRAL